MTTLIKFNEAYHALMVAKSIDEVKEVRDKMEALRLYLKQQGESLEMQNACAEIKLRAERRAGEILKEMPKNEGVKGQLNGRDSSGGNTMLPPEDDTPTLADIGLTKMQSSRFQSIASIPAEIFEARIIETKARKFELTSAEMLKVAKELRLKAERERRQEEKSKRHLPDQQDAGIEAILNRLYQGDFREVCRNLTDNSLNAIIADPPYPKEYLPLYESLAAVAARLLKPGGSLLVMCGQSYLPEIFKLMTPHLNYQWTISYQTPGGQSPQIWQRKINTFWKPVLWFVKGEYQGDWHGDVIKSDVNDNDKRFHRWGQSESGAARLIEGFTRPGDLVLDPFMGGGTNGVVSLALGRQFVGIEIEAEAFKVSRERIYEICLTL